MKKLTTEEFIERAIKVHGNKFDYSEVEYIYAKTKVKIFCKKCKKFFYQTPAKHISVRQGCPRCSGKYIYGQDEFIERAQKIHGKDRYNYELVNFINTTTQVEIICNNCNTHFWQTPNNHLRQKGCVKCARKKVGLQKSLGLNTFIQKAQKIHGDKYDYSEAEYINNIKKVKIFCKKCKEFFYQSPTVHLRGSGCQKCSPKSVGENKIKEWLNNNYITYINEKRFNDCRDKNPLPFDFYLPDYNVCIEFQGEQHYKPTRYIEILKSKEKGLEAFKKQQYHDQIKRDYCNKNNILLLEIKYNDNIEQKLNENIKKE